ncbi:hypothetical protein AB4K20DRAFT_1862607 [Rhizopus microsporus]|uniref:Uncharacterized protein n=1 Tax=Rhizopus microsporus TaxID=58291 RepID=A0A1X0SD71_RHIZD|nr:hypothetical protein BCV71DRAFT_231580 [Rhizopus microsporus]
MSSTTPTINDRQKSVLIVKKVIVVIVITDTTLPTLKLFAIVLLLLLDIEGQRKKKKRKTIRIVNRLLHSKKGGGRIRIETYLTEICVVLTTVTANVFYWLVTLPELTRA